MTAPTPPDSDRIPIRNPEDEGTPTEAHSGDKTESIGPYQLLHKIGEGGMGEVWLAEQNEPVRRRVALKVIKTGMDTKQVVARFEAERQALALMDHPSIARVFDAGETPAGRPYFVMEHVQGVPISEYCDRNRLTNRERIELFVQVCEGVQHAHQKAIIHRDLKPSNMLVTLQGGKAVPKIIDFGVAKATAQPLTEKTMFTELGVLIGTPEYMSPEQAEMTGQGIDTRTDVYALGVVLYELLVGALPFDPEDLRKAGFQGIVRKIREDEPPKPSTRLTSLGERSMESARCRRVDVRTLRSQIRGDLDWITMKALEKDRTRRYGSPAELAGDLVRYLRDEPVLAGPPSAAYRARKFVRRHRIAVSAAGVVMLALAVGVGGLATGLVRATRAEATTKVEAETARQVSEFLVDLFRDVDPRESRGNSMTVREVLDRGTREIGWHLKSQPLVKARMMATIANASLGLFAQAKPLLEEALEFRSRLLGPKHAEVAESMDDLGMLLFSSGDYGRAQELLEAALDVRQATLGPDHLAVASSLHHVASIRRFRGDVTGVRNMHERALAIREKVLGPDHPTVAESLLIVSSTLRLFREYDRARSLNERAIAIDETALGADSPELAHDLEAYANLLVDMGRISDARANYERALRIMEQDYGAEHPIVAHTLDNLALLLANSGQHDEARTLYQRAVAIQEKALGPRHRDTGWSFFGLGLLEQEAGDLARARFYHTRALDIRSDTLGWDHSEVGQSLECLSEVLEAQGDVAGALDFSRRALENRVKSLGPAHPDTQSSLGHRVRLLRRLGREDEARVLTEQMRQRTKD